MHFAERAIKQEDARLAVAWRVSGVVQGVGFRPWVCRVARSLGVGGGVCNSSLGVEIRAVGPEVALSKLFRAIRDEAPPPARVGEIRPAEWPPGMVVPGTDLLFSIEGSEGGPGGGSGVSPDLATCAECRRELCDPASRRYRYPFISCARCGPRYTILEGLPFDRERTVMRSFPLCEPCRQEYEDPADRRFHAQATACPDCGPSLRWLGPGGGLLGEREAALEGALVALREGRVVATLGVGGFHLMVRADSGEAVLLLRQRKRRPHKPLAVVCLDLVQAREHALVCDVEAEVLESAAAPIVLLEKRSACKRGLADSVAPGVPCIGIMLASSPLHILLLEGLGVPMVATSGNRGDEPLCREEAEAVRRLGGMADYFLSHNRPVARPVDDSIVRVIGQSPRVFRRARGYVPAPLEWPLLREGAPAVLGSGGQQKNAVAMWAGGKMFLGPHIGDMASPLSRRAWRNSVADLIQWDAGVAPQAVGVDFHADYASTIEGESLGLACVRVQHHAAHAFAGLIECRLDSALAVVWDGSGDGGDGTVWGGEFLRVRAGRSPRWERVGHLRPFLLPGGEAAIRRPALCALGVWAAMQGTAPIAGDPIFGQLGISHEEARTLARVLETGAGSVMTTSAGRLFDAMAVLLGVAREVTYDAQAAMSLEAAATGWHPPEAGLAEPEIFVRGDGMREMDWMPTARTVAASPSPLGERAAAWHGLLALGIARMAAACGERDVLLTGGCFQNRLLLEEATRSLSQLGMRPHFPSAIPPNDGGLASGQCTLAALEAQA